MEGRVEESPESTLGSSSDELNNDGCCNPKKLPFRLSGLILMCLLGFGKKYTLISNLKTKEIILLLLFFMFYYTYYYYIIMNRINDWIFQTRQY